MEKSNEAFTSSSSSKTLFLNSVREWKTINIFK